MPSGGVTGRSRHMALFEVNWSSTRAWHALVNRDFLHQSLIAINGRVTAKLLILKVVYRRIRDYLHHSLGGEANSEKPANSLELHPITWPLPAAPGTLSTAITHARGFGGVHGGGARLPGAQFGHAKVRYRGLALWQASAGQVVSAGGAGLRRLPDQGSPRRALSGVSPRRDPPVVLRPAARPSNRHRSGGVRARSRAARC